MTTHAQPGPDSTPRRLWRRVGVLLLVLVLYLSLKPEAPEPPPQGLDKFEHALAYGVLMFWFAHLVPARRGRWRLAVGLAGMGVAIECLQGLIGYRHFSFADMGANAVGVLLGWIAAPPRMPDLLRRAEAWRSRW